MNWLKEDKVSTGLLIGLVLPILFVSAFLLFSSSKCGSYMECFHHFQRMDIMYKIVSVSLMPGTGLFFWWSKVNKLNTARGLLMVTLFYGVFVLMLYMF